MCSLWVACLLTGPAAAADPPTEVALVRSALAQPWSIARQDARVADARADGTAPPLLADPELLARREQANGPAGANTRVVGGGITVDLGLSSLPRRTASSLRGQAGERAARADAVAVVCDLRADVLELVAASGRVRAREAWSRRLDTVQGQLGAEAGVGLTSGFDRDRLALVARTRRFDLDLDRARSADVGARLEARTGLDPSGLQLGDLPDLEPVDAWLQRALAEDPELAALRLRVDAARSLVAAERRAQAPDLDLYGGARWDAMPDGSSREGGWEVGGALQLPIFDRGREDRRRAEAELRAAEAAAQEREVLLQSHIHAAWTRVQTLADGGDPLAADALWAGAVDRYLGGEATLSELLDVASEAEAAALVDVQRAIAVRRARLDLACASGRFEEPVFNDIIDEVAR